MKFQIQDEETWSETWPQIEGKAGIYKVFSIDTKTGKNLSIPRILDIDDSGTIYIGMSKNLSARIAEVRKSLFGAYQHGDYKSVSAHQTGKKASEVFRANFPIEAMWVEIFPGDVSGEEGPYDARKEESRMLSAYVDKFGDTPPLNA
ncbi:hypothetical protein ABUE34_13815 (plasmid) [Kozakia baliensis]|uniref:hypothetical protein n=1 Tax=Kozakia baliensis TaxID=153496 RepID=UPI00345BA24D